MDDGVRRRWRAGCRGESSQRGFFEGLIRDAGLQMTRLDHQSKPVTGQSVVVAECISCNCKQKAV